ncbi:hypothetical protein [Aquisediminimonas sediminicola]|uniref:hypothetical protein n=1 Tax=Alteraquisediminimonas sediminicola TaxID=2676787 RepID=UPI001C8F0E78|nr:hypothetical protein [Aquisediminimonas sediminicola]
MTMRWSYIGQLGENGALDWKGNYSGNIPVGGRFLPDWNDTALYLKIRDLARDGRYHGAQVDWGAFAVKVNGTELLSILDECYGPVEEMKSDTLLARYISFAERLGAGNYVALVSCEI